jgi:tetratricopeptide (TPR) repeat protein
MPGIDEATKALELAEQAFARLDVEGAVAHLSAAIRGFTAADDKCRAAMTCVRLGETLVHGMGNLTASRAWFARARRLIEGEPVCVEQGWVAVAAMGCDVDDPAELLAAAELALDRARRFGDVNLETKALADAGLAHVQAGRVAEGMALLDEAMALACGPADDSHAAGKSVCSFFTACYYATEFEKAAAWTNLLRQQGLIGRSIPAVVLSGHCDSVQATLLVELGRWAEAEAVLVRARAEIEAVMHTSGWHPEIALADLRIRQGRLLEAETLLLGKDQHMQALLPAARLHLARGDHELARATALRGLRVVRDDRLRAVELLTMLVDAELAAGDVPAATRASVELTNRTADLPVAALRARAAAARARVLTAAGDLGGAVTTLESALQQVEGGQLLCLRATLLLDLARARERAGDRLGAAIDAKAAGAAVAKLDVVLAPADLALLERFKRGSSEPPLARIASLACEGTWWVASFAGASVRLPGSKGLRYLAELLGQPGIERHVLDLVDRVDGLAPDADRRALGDAGPALDGEARTAYRRRIEQLREAADEALTDGRLEAAEAMQREIDQLVSELARAFGLGGRDRRVASAAERARLNVTRALRASIARLAEGLPAAPALDHRVRTGLYCCYQPAPEDDVRWVVQS